jgi:enoyl-CoA hydratase
MEYKNLLFQKQGHVAHITFNRPEKMNALSLELFAEWDAALKDAQDDDDVKVILIKGAGKCFSAGMDLGTVGFMYGMKEPKPGEKPPKVTQQTRLKIDRKGICEFHRELFLCSKLTVVQMHGHGLGMAFNLALHCDFIFASEDCKIGHVEERLGLGGMTITPIMILRAGFSRAMELCLTGKMITGKEAAEIGLINRAVPGEKLETEVTNFIEGLTQIPLDGVALGKAQRHLMYESMGITDWFGQHYIMHAFQTNRVFLPGEGNFFKERKEKGVRESAHTKHEWFKKLD